MDVMDVFTHFERLGEGSGVRVYIADYDPDTGHRRFGIGMHGVQKRFIRDPSPALVLGLDSRKALTERGFGAFLNLPCVRYLELPFTQDEFQQQAKSVCGIKVDVNALDGVRRSVTEDGLENIRCNVTHRLNGATLVWINRTVAECRKLAKVTDTPLNASDELTRSITVLASLDKKVRETLAILDRQISALDGICYDKESKVLWTQRIGLGKAADNLNRFVEGVAAWKQGKLEESLDQLADIGAGVSRVFIKAGSEFTRLSGGRREM